MRRLLRWLAIALFVAVCALVWLARRLPHVPATPAAVIPALNQNAVPIVTDDPAADDHDMEPLLTVLRNHSIVALGEATHGTREFFRLKDRILRALVRHAGFKTFALEISPEAGQIVDRYVRHGEGDPKDALRHFEFWTWKTQEVLELVQWMRAWNVQHPAAEMLSFVGINSVADARDLMMAKNVEQAWQAAGRDRRMVVWAHNDHVATDSEHMGGYLRRSFGGSLYVVGFEFSEGCFRSRNLMTLRTHCVKSAGPEYYASSFASLSNPIVFLDFKQAAQIPVLAQWLGWQRLSRDIDELFYVSQFSERWYSRWAAWPELYDGIIFVRSTTPAHGLSGNP